MATDGNSAANALEDAASHGYKGDFGEVVCIANRLRKAGIIRPYDTFEVSNGNSMSLFGLLLTFVIILMQFRLGEV